MCARLLTRPARRFASGVKLSDEAHKTLESFLGVLTRQRKKAIKQLDGQIVDMSEAIVTVAKAARKKKSGSVLASIQSTITRLAAHGESAASLTIAPPPLPVRGRMASLLEQCRLEWRRGMTLQQLAARVDCSDKTARRHINTILAELGEDEPVPFAVARKRA
jgi:hypothetical protein